MSKKKLLLTIISVVMLVLMVTAILCAITVTGSGFLDLSNLARYLFVGIAIICGVVSLITWKIAKKSE